VLLLGWLRFLLSLPLGPPLHIVIVRVIFVLRAAVHHVAFPFDVVLVFIVGTIVLAILLTVAVDDGVIICGALGCGRCSPLCCGVLSLSSCHGVYGIDGLEDEFVKLSSSN